jgi:hypothetical protein
VDTKTVNEMERVIKVSLEKILNNQINNLNGKNERVAIIEGGFFKVQSLLSEIGNNNIDNWNNINKISKSTSNKNICNYLNKFINELTIIGQ